MSRKLLSSEIVCWRICCGSTLLDHVGSKEIRNRIDVQYTIVDKTTEKRLNWYGRMRLMKEERISIRVGKWAPVETREKGKRRKNRPCQIKERMGSKRLQPEEFHGKRDGARDVRTLVIITYIIKWCS